MKTLFIPLRIALLSLLFSVCCPLIPAASKSDAGEGGESSLSESAKPVRFEAGKGRFMLDGEPFTVKAAELHYPRIPRPYWEQRIRMCKALGMNAVCLYVFWNIHEQEPGVFDFEGNNDLRAFIELCRDNDLKVILRPGPYVCAEWEMGGLPWWLLRDKDIALRENDPRFLAAVERFMERVAAEVGDLTADKGGPIVMVQVENEYGSYGKNKEYVSNIRDMVRRNFGEGVLLFQCDWSSNFTDNGLDDLLWTMNFGTGADISREFAPLKKLRPESPLMCSEFWSGWFDKWGANHETRPADDMIAGLEEMLRNDISFSLYMTHGGTNWGHWAGANSPGYAPDVTSYDYDAPINEWGYPMQKFWKLREMMKRYSADSLPPLPEPVPLGTIREFSVTEVAPLFLLPNLRKAGHFDAVPNMESLGQGFGSVLYSTILPGESGEESELLVTEPHDFVQVWLNGKYIGKIDRREGEKSLKLPPFGAGSKLDLLVEAMGRINFGRAIKDFKGITEKVELLSGGETRELRGWNVALLPDKLPFYENMQFVNVEFADTAMVKTNLTPGNRLPGVYRAKFTVDRPADTFLDMSSWGKGLVYVNGHGLGRFWEIGPQQTLYLPGCWLREGENELLVLDIIGPSEAKLRGLDAPILDVLGGSSSVDITDPSLRPVLDPANIAVETVLLPGNGWQTVDFAGGKPFRGKRLVLEIVDSYDESGLAAISELYLLDASGNRLPRESWRAAYASSQDAAGGNHTLDKAFDLQESTYWQSAPSAAAPHLLVIDLDGEVEAAAIQLLPRMESGAPAAPRTLRASLLP